MTRRSGASAWPAGPIGQAGQPLVTESAQPLVRGGPRDPQGFSGDGRSPALLDHPADDQSPAVNVETRYAVGHQEPSRGPEPLDSPRPSGMALPLSTRSVGATASSIWPDRRTPR